MNGKLKPWEAYPDIWKSEAAFMSWLRGGIRAGLWNKHPIKLEFLKKNRIKVPNTNPRSMKRFPEVWAAQCAITGDIIPLTKAEVDHKTGNHSLRTVDDIAEFIKGIVLIGDEDLQIVSKDVHKIKSHAEKQGITFEDAMIEKKVIAFGKLSTEEQKQKLTEIYGSDKISSLTNKSKRLAAYKEWLKGAHEYNRTIQGQDC